MICGDCGFQLAPPGQPWKGAAALREIPLAEIPGAAFAGDRPGVLLRQFACPGCGLLLDTDTAMAGDPFLDDVAAL